MVLAFLSFSFFWFLQESDMIVLCGGSNPHMKKAYEGNPGKGSTQAEL